MCSEQREGNAPTGRDANTPKTTPHKPKSGVFQFKVTGPNPAEYVVDISTYPGTVKSGKTAQPDATLTIEDEYLVRIAAGKLDVQTAFIQGRLTVDGDYGQAMRLAKLLGKMLDSANT